MSSGLILEHLILVKVIFVIRYWILSILIFIINRYNIFVGGLINPPVTSDPLKDINDRIAKHAAAQDYFLATIRMTKKDTEKNETRSPDTKK